MSVDLPDLTDSDVRDWTVDRYYGRGEGYYHEDRIHRTRREGHTLRALCHGSRPDPYRVEVTLDDEGIAYGSCSCPIGAGGRCKHAVALLLTWIHQPDVFEPVEPLENRLWDQSKDTLVSILQHLIDRDPAVEALVEMHLATPDGTQEDTVRAYVEQAFAGSRHDPYDPGYGGDVAENLDPLLERGHEHLDAQEWEAAARLFRTVATTVREQYESGYDEDGSIISVLDACATGLGTVLSETADEDLRPEILEALLDLFLWNAEEGGFGAGDAAAEVAAERLSDYRLKEVADRLVERGAETRARRLVERRLNDEGLSAKSMLTWLYEHALASDDYEEALDAARRLFDQRPSVTAYKQVRAAADPLGQWSSIRDELLAELEDSPYLDVLVNIHLHEDDPERALEWVEPFAGEERNASFGVPFLRSVAEAVADSHPKAAVALYEECARRLIDQRGRSNYNEAANFLQRAKAICEREGDEEAFASLLDALYDDELHRLPAARDEFQKADLL